MPRTMVDEDGFLMDDPYADFPDPPHVAGDHAAVCRGCPKCDAEEAAWFAKQTGKDTDMEDEQ